MVVESLVSVVEILVSVAEALEATPNIKNPSANSQRVL